MKLLVLLVCNLLVWRVGETRSDAPEKLSPLAPGGNWERGCLPGSRAGRQLVWEAAGLGGECTLSTVPLGQTRCVRNWVGDGHPGMAMGGLVGDGG